jgi:polyribonucleotide nucleotidyltransferase
MEAAIQRVRAITAVPEVGEVYEAKIKTIMPYGAFVEFLPGREGLLHISEYAWERTQTLDGLVKEGEMIQVKLIDIDSRSGKFKLSRKVLLPNTNPHHDRDRDRDRDYRRRDRDDRDRGDRRYNRPPRRRY